MKQAIDNERDDEQTTTTAMQQTVSWQHDFFDDSLFL